MTLERIEKFLNAVKPEDQYNDFLKGKRVAIVGPSKHILLEKNGAKIDDYDIVIRLKWLPMKGFNIFKESIGDDTHVMYSSAVNRREEYDILSESDIKFTRHPECKVGSESANIVYNDITAMVYTSEEYAFILKDYATENGYAASKLASINSKSPYSIWPQLGFNAIMEAIASDAKEVYITGFTMYHGGGHMLQKNKPAHHNKTIVEKHNGVLEVLVLNDVIKHIEKKITLDPILKKILDAYEELDLDNPDLIRGKELYTPVMNTLTDEINDLVKDL